MKGSIFSSQQPTVSEYRVAAVRPPASLPANSQFFGSEEGTRASLVLLSLVQSCREHGVSPLLYLRHVLRAVSTTPASQVASLTPRAWQEHLAMQQRAEQAQRAIDTVVEELLSGR
ncbi:MAG: transposase domain-containing protein [Planctomycetes bacterium]|nr:transposase domain-containing protein [Planctomycetota bacterium]